MAGAIDREVPLMTSPPLLRGLGPFTNKTGHRPGVDEFLAPLALHAGLGIALGNMNGPDAQALGQRGP
jgi:hypothetical protein